MPNLTTRRTAADDWVIVLDGWENEELSRTEAAELGSELLRLADEPIDDDETDRAYERKAGK